MVFDDEINEIEEGFHVDEIKWNLVNNVVSKPEEFSEISRRNTHFIRPSTLWQGIYITFPLGSSQGKLQPLKKLALPQLGEKYLKIGKEAWIVS